MGRKEIIATYERLEKEAGGLWHAVARDILGQTAEACGVSREEARAVMIDHWTKRGAG